MGDLAGKQHLLLEAVRRTRVSGDLRQDYLQCNMYALQETVFDIVNLSHTAVSDKAMYGKAIGDHLSGHETAPR